MDRACPGYYDRHVRIDRAGRRESHRGAAVVLLLAALLTATTARGQLLRIIDDPRVEPGAEFGRALAAVDGDVAVGAPGARVFDSDGAGRVQLFAANGTLLRTFEALTPVAGAALGTTVVANAGRLYVGAPGDQPIGVGGLGAVYVFDAASGAVIRIVSAPDPDANTVPVGGTLPGGALPTSNGPTPVAQGFARALAVSGDRVVVGAPDSAVDDLGGAGAVFVFGTDGALLRTLTDPTPRTNAFFGASVAVVGDALVVGVPGAPSGGDDGAGIVQVFDATTGALRRTVSAPISTPSAEFGAVVGGLAGALFVSAPRDPATGSDAAGAVYLFTPATTRFSRIVTPPTSEPGLDFGRAVVAVGGNLLIGADGAGGDQSGEAFLIEPVTNAVVAQFTPSVPRAGGQFGFALAAADSVFAIGEPALGDASAVGRVYLFGPSSASPIGGTPGAPGMAPPGRTTARCPAGTTTAAIDCRLAALVTTVHDDGMPRLAGSLRRAGRHLRRADAARGARRLRALRRAARGVGDVASRLQSGRGGAAVPAETRAVLAAEASAVRTDLLSLAQSSGR
jgi:hypothetical protein